MNRVFRFGALAVIGSAAVGVFAVKTSGYPPFVKAKTLYAKNDYRGKRAPKLEVGQWLTGGAPHTKGKVVLIDFWATWCPPCRATIPELGQWQKKFKKDLVVIGISDEKPEVVRKFMQSTSMPYNVAIDQKKTMSGEVGVQGIPHVLVISSDGVVRWQGFPLDDKDKLTDAKIEQIIRASKAGKQG